MINKKEIEEAPKFSQMLSFEERLQVIHMNKNLYISVKDISKELSKNDSSIRQIIHQFEQTGRINKLLTTAAK